VKHKDPPERSIFDRFAEAFPLASNENERWAKEGPFLVSLIRSSGERKRRVLDLACGNGFHARQLAKEGFAVCGLEISSTAIHKGRTLSNGMNVTWIQGDIREPFPGVFDTILLLGNTLSLLDNRDDVCRVFSNAREALCPRGIFVVHVIDFNYLEKNPVEIERAGRIENEAATFRKTLVPQRGGATIRIRVTRHRASGPYIEEGAQRLTNHDSEFLRRCATRYHMPLVRETGGFNELVCPPGQSKDRVYIFSRHR
jgi:SAM-dependent methyltransferase